MAAHICSRPRRQLPTLTGTSSHICVSMLRKDSAVWASGRNPCPSLGCGRCGCVADPRNPGFQAVDTLCLTLRAVSVFQHQGQERHHGRMECFVGVLGKNGGDADIGRGNGERNTIQLNMNVPPGPQPPRNSAAPFLKFLEM